MNPLLNLLSSISALVLLSTFSVRSPAETISPAVPVVVYDGQLRPSDPDDGLPQSGFNYDDGATIPDTRAYDEAENLSLAYDDTARLPASQNNSVREANRSVFDRLGRFLAAEGGTVRVGRWMSQAEADAMTASGRVQAPLNGAGATHVTVPPNPAAFTPPPSSSTFLEFDVPSSQLRIHDPGQGWGRIFGPDSIEARLAARQGLPVPTQMPPATGIQPTASAWPRR